MRILLVVDRPKSALDILSHDIVRYCPHFQMDIIAVHPKRPSAESLRAFEDRARLCDVIHFQYWRSAELLMERFPWIEEKATILSHYNPYDLEAADWSRYNRRVVVNHEQHKILPGAALIPLCVDMEMFRFGEEENDYTVGMVAGRIESNKGILQVAQVCNELGYKFLLVGRLPGSYFQEIQQAAGERFEFRRDVSVEDLVTAYHEMTVLVVNSVDGFESGPLPVLEAMACGTPVLTRLVGSVPDIDHGDNMVVRNGKRSDLEDLTVNLQRLMQDKGLRDRTRLRGWWTVKDRTSRHAARMYGELYYSVRSPLPLVSVILPTFNRAESLPQIIKAVEDQTYQNIELVVCDDGSIDETRAVIDAARLTYKTPIRYLNTGDTNSYHLAKARNMGIVECQGQYVVFCDDRLAMAPDAVEWFVTALEQFPTRWGWGVKDGALKGFVENFSAVRRKLLIAGGMLLERIEWYGGLSQEIRTRYRQAGVTFVRVEEAHATSIRGTSRWHNRKEDVVKSKFLLFQLYGGGSNDE